MHRHLLLLSLLFLSFILHAQNVRIKDSSVSYSNGVLGSFTVSTFHYNSDCLIDTAKYPNSRTIFTYNPDKTVLQSLAQNFDSTSGKYINSFRAIYEYNSSGKTTFTLFQNWDVTNNGFTNWRRDSLFYDQDDKLTRNVIQFWNSSIGNWATSGEVNWFYNEGGQIDSTINEYFPYSITKSYYTYSSEPSKDYQIKSYNYYNNNLLGISRTSYYIDSANYVVTDSSVNEILGQDSIFTPTSISYSVVYYNTDNTIKEDDYTFTDVQSNQVSSFKSFYTYAPCSLILPVSFISLSSERQNNNALLHWQTADEINTSAYYIQRSTDGEHFSTVGKTTAIGNSNSDKKYTYNDINAFSTNASNLYYRLAAINKDGNINYSKTIMLDIAAGKLYVYASPNPIVNTIHLYATTEINRAIITVTDLRGKVLYSGTQNINVGSNSFIDASTYAKGVYLVSIQSASLKQQFKIVKE